MRSKSFLTAKDNQIAFILGGVAKASNTSTSDLLLIPLKEDWCNWVDINMGVAYIMDQREQAALEQAREDAKREAEEAQRNAGDGNGKKVFTSEF